jgi:HPt (histidine-containing phosphotransfer) domain-containing protein
MQEEYLQKKFSFHDNIDTNFLYTMYADDFECMEDIFATTCKHLGADLNLIKTAFEAHNLSDVKKGIHKIKPTFGFVGLLDMQHLCEQVEALCLSVADWQLLQTDYLHLVAAIEESGKIIEAEYLKLKAYNAHSI